MLTIIFLFFVLSNSEIFIVVATKNDYNYLALFDSNTTELNEYKNITSDYIYWGECLLHQRKLYFTSADDSNCYFFNEIDFITGKKLNKFYLDVSLININNRNEIFCTTRNAEIYQIVNGTLIEKIRFPNHSIL